MAVEHVWFWMPNPEYPAGVYGQPEGLIVAKIRSATTSRDVTIEVTHSVNSRFPVGHIARRCRLKMRDATIDAAGIPRDKSTNKEIVPMKTIAKEIESAGNEDAAFNPDKYDVVKMENGNVGRKVKDHFVLLPEKDPAALQALKAYAINCKSPKFKESLLGWIAKIERDLTPLWKNGKNLGSLGRINAGIDVLKK